MSEETPQRKRLYSKTERESSHRSHKSSQDNRRRHHHSSSSRHHSSSNNSDRKESSGRHSSHNRPSRSHRSGSRGSLADNVKNEREELNQSVNVTPQEKDIKTDKDEFKGYKVIEAPDFDSSEDELEVQHGISNVLKDKDGYINLGLFQSEDLNVESQPEEQKIQIKSESVTETVDEEDQDESMFSPTSILNVNYEFGDRGSNWRMMKLNKILEQSKWDPYKDEEEYVFERYGDLRLFYIALEEKEELECRKKVRDKNKWIYKPTGRLIKENGLQVDERNDEVKKSNNEVPGKVITLDDVTEARISMMRAKLNKSTTFDSLENKYNELKASYDQLQKHHYIITKLINTPAKEDEMTIDQMVIAERTQTSKSALKRAAKQIASIKTFDNTDLDQQDEQANKLAGLTKTSEISLQKFIENPKLVKALETCRFCKENKSQNLPVLMSTENFYISPMAKPEISKKPGCIIIPLKHFKNSLHLSAQQYEELMQIMESLSMFYFKEYKSNVIFYEESIFDTSHLTIKCIPIPASFDSKAVASYFRAGIMEQVLENNDNQHKSIIDTSNGYRTKIAKEAPFYHVWFTLDGGFGHIVEDVLDWPGNDGFSRNVIGNFLEADAFAIRARPKFNFYNEDGLSEFCKKLDIYFK